MGSCNPCNPVHGDLPPRCFINNIKPVIWWKSFLWVTPLIHFDRGLYIWKWRKKEKKVLGLDWKKTTFYNCTLTLSNTHTQGDTHTHTFRLTLPLCWWRVQSWWVRTAARSSGSGSKPPGPPLCPHSLDSRLPRPATGSRQLINKAHGVNTCIHHV